MTRAALALLAVPACASISIEYRFNSDGQAYTPEGVPVTGVTFGFDPLPPCECASSSAILITSNMPFEPPVVVDAPTPEPPPTSETPEPASWLVGAELIALARWRRR